MGTTLLLSSVENDPRAATQVPEELFRSTAPLLSQLACLAPAPHSASAASLLADGFLSRGAERWKAVMGPHLVNFIDRVFSVCELLSHDPLSSGSTSEAPERRKSAFSHTGEGQAICTRAGDEFCLRRCSHLAVLGVSSAPAHHK
eukprot:scaffold241276_cov27-Prasinocladus_malaysianus.AAC.1